MPLANRSTKSGSQGSLARTGKSAWVDRSLTQMIAGRAEFLLIKLSKRSCARSSENKRWLSFSINRLDTTHRVPSIRSPQTSSLALALKDESRQISIFHDISQMLLDISLVDPHRFPFSFLGAKQNILQQFFKQGVKSTSSDILGVGVYLGG